MLTGPAGFVQRQRPGTSDAQGQHFLLDPLSHTLCTHSRCLPLERANLWVGSHQWWPEEGQGPGTRGDGGVAYLDHGGGLCMYTFVKMHSTLYLQKVSCTCGQSAVTRPTIKQ